MSVPQKAKFKIDFANASDRGQRRPENFDSFGKFPHDHSDLSTTKGQLFIVADAKSRNPSGRDAGKMSIRIIQENYFAYPSEDPVFSLQRAFDTANRQIFQYAKANGLHRKIGATVSALVLTDKNAYVAHVGDCRVFRVSVKRIDRLTNDHTRVIELQADGKRPARNKTILTRALGIKLGMRIDTSNRLPIHRDEYFLLATDGLSVLSEEEIKNVILSSAPQSACRRLVEMARMRGSRDDITVQIVKLYHQFKEVQIETYAHVDDLEGISNGPILFMLAFMVAMTGFIFRDSLLEKFSGVVASFATEYKLVTVNTDDSPNKMLNDRRLENANYMLRNGRVQEALQSFQQMLRDDPTHNGALDGIYKVAEAYTQQGDRDRQKGRLFEARSSYNQALKLNPNDPVARRRLADMDRREATPPPSSRRGRVKTTIPKLDTRQSSNSYLEKGIKDLGVRGIRRAEWTLNGLDEYQDFQYRRSNLTVYNNIRIKKAF
nr:protein phosphatase 2C domain-containing protein [Calditrichia bacterium]